MNYSTRSLFSNGCFAEFRTGDATNTGLADKSVDLVLGSPPYLKARTYNIGAQRGLEAWVEFMLACTREGLRISKGLVLWVCAGTAEDCCYQPGPEALLAKAHYCATNFCDDIEIWRPAIWHKVDEHGGGTGIPGSGGKQWLRNDWEYVLAFKNAGPLPFADPTVYPGRAPKYPPGGRIRNRQQSGRRELQTYKPPALVNPGNVIKARVGGNHMGDAECYETDAPYPERLAERLVMAFCPPGGVTVDPFSGSGTTVLEAVRWGRNGIGIDLRPDQVELAYRRLQRRVAEGRAVAATPWPRRGTCCST